MTSAELLQRKFYAWGYTWADFHKEFETKVSGQSIDPNILLHMSFDMPPNTNNMYLIKNNRKILTSEARAYKAAAIQSIRIKHPDFSIPLQTPLAIQFYLYFPENQINNRDYDGCLKAIQDCIFEASNPKGNDAWVRHAIIEKVKMPKGCEPKCWITLTKL
jgi:Holliday junction resolvase RusA-like endonuclease